MARVRRAGHEPAPHRRDGRWQEESRSRVRRRPVRRLDQEHARPARHVQGLPRRRASPRFRFVIEGKESELLATYLSELAEAAYDSLAARYQYSPPTPIRLEVYRSHADFSVRTVGLAGLGALGVSFGTTLAMDSPAARDAGEFNWGSTFWHELAHTFTLGASEHRVPRWLSEGLSVLEERRARLGWGADVSPGVPRRVQGGQAREGQPHERRLHAARVSAADHLLVLSGVARRGAHRARLRAARDRRHAERVQDRSDDGAGVPARAQDESRGVRREVRRVHEAAVRSPRWRSSSRRTSVAMGWPGRRPSMASS